MSLSRFSLEAYDDVAPGATGTTAVLPLPFNPAVSEQESAYTSPINEIEATLVDADVVLESAGTLKLHCGVLSTYATEGISEQAGAVLTVSVEALCRKLGLTLPQALPAMEAFDSVHTSGPATRLSLETLQETLSTIWRVLLETFKKIWAKLSSFIGSILVEGEKNRREKATRALETKVTQLKRKPVDAEVAAATVGGIRSIEVIKAFSLDGRTASGESVIHILESTVAYGEFLKAISGEFTKYLYAMLDSLKNYKVGETFEVTKLAENTLNATIEHAFHEVHEGAMAATVKEIKRAHNASSVVIAGPLVNSGYFVYFKTMSDPSTEAYTCVYVPSVLHYVDSAELVMDVPSLVLIEQINKLDSAFMDLGDNAVVAARQIHPSLVNKIFAQINEIQHAVKSSVAAGTLPENFADYTQEQSRMLRNFLNNYTAMFANGIATLSNTHKRVTRLVELSIAHYDKDVKTA